MDESDYGNPSGQMAVNDRQLRQLSRIKSSLSYRLGRLLVDSARSVWRAPLLPLTIPHLFWTYANERIGRKGTIVQDMVNDDLDQRNCAVLFPTNGVGMGHFARMYSLALAMRRFDPTLEVVFFTTNYVLHPLYSEGITAYHLPGRKKFGDMSPRVWNSQCEEMLSNVFSLHKPSYFVFDGAYPYRGMLNAIKNRRNVTKVWVRRISRAGKGDVPIDSYSTFDRIVVPGDIIEPNMEELAKWPVDEISLTNPILSVSRSDLLPRGDLRSRLGIPMDALTCLVSLGAGEINDISNMREFVVRGLVERGVYVIIADSMLKPMNARFDQEKVRVIQKFPIMRNRNCLDFSVIAGGYNSVNECISLRLPSVIIPNFDTSRDDQPGRANQAGKIGGAIVVEKPYKDVIELALDRVCDPSIRAGMAENLIANIPDDGADSLAESILSGPSD